MLNTYQKAVLTEIGIEPLTLREDREQKSERHDQSNQHQNFSQPESLTDSCTTPSERLAALKKNLVETTKTKIHGKILVAFKRPTEYLQLFNDIAFSLDLNMADMHFTDESVERFEGQKFTWRLNDSISYSADTLVTPGLHELTKPDVKRALWSAISVKS